MKKGKDKRFHLQAKNKVLIGIVLFIFFLLCQASTAVTGEEEKKEEKTVLEEITVTGTPYSNPVTPMSTRYGTQYNLVTEEQIREQNAYDFQSTLCNVPGVMFQKKNLIGEQTGHSLYIRGRGSSHPSSDFVIQFDGVPRYGAIFGQVLGDSIAISTIGGIEVYKSPQLQQFGSGYASVNILPKYLTKEGQEIVSDFSGGSYYTFAESLSGGIKTGPFDIYASQSFADTDGHRDSQHWAVAEGRRDHSGAQQQNYYANLGYQMNKE